MMYDNKFAIAVKAKRQGETKRKILREFNKDTVYVPFGSEYSLLLKNLNSVRAMVHVWIDGKDVTEGGLVVWGGSEVDLERSIVGNNLSEGNCFKFIERTSAIENHRGIEIEDGLVRVEFNFERPQPSFQWPHYISNTYGTWGQVGSSQVDSLMANPSFAAPVGGRGTSCGVSGGADSFGQAHVYYSAAGLSSAGLCTPQNEVKSTLTTTANDAGITVAGSISDQKFVTASWFATESESHVMVLKLLGFAPDGHLVTVPVTVKAKPTCSSCGRVNKATAKFCAECGTSLQIVGQPRAVQG